MKDTQRNPYHCISQYDYVTRRHFKANFLFGLHVQKVRAMFSVGIFTLAYLVTVKGPEILPI